MMRIDFMIFFITLSIYVALCRNKRRKGLYGRKLFDSLEDMLAMLQLRGFEDLSFATVVFSNSLGQTKESKLPIESRNAVKVMLEAESARLFNENVWMFGKFYILTKDGRYFCLSDTDGDSILDKNIEYTNLNCETG